MGIKLNVRGEMGPMSMRSHIEGDKVIVTMECDYRVSVASLPDNYQGPCIEVMQRDPLVMFVHGERKPAAVARLVEARKS